MKFGQFIYVILKRKNLSKTSTKNKTWKLVPGPFAFVKI